MANRRMLEQQYSSLSGKINNFLRKNTGYVIHGVARQGSRKEGTHDDDSDLDIIFAIARNPAKQTIYPDLVEKLSNNMGLDASIGSSYNVINLQKGDLEVDLVLLTVNQFDSQCRSGRYRRYNDD